MKIIRTLTFTVLSVIITAGVSFAQNDGSLFKNVIESEVTVTASKLNLRTGPGSSFPVVGSVVLGQALQVIGTLDGWYIVILPDTSIGVISYQYVKVSKIGEKLYIDEEAEGASEETGGEEEMSDAEIMFDLINKVRAENKQSPFPWDEKLNRIAEIKARDMKDNDYFEHSSPVYGTPFAMLKQLGVLYKSASENISGSNSAENAHMEIMTNVHQRVNVLNANFTKVGIGVCDGGKWGKIAVQIFIEE